jgi:NTE family protein
LPGQIVLVLQGGGALGAYQLGVYQALHEAGIEPDWVIGTSIGAINGAIIAGNPPERRLDQLREFWHRMERNSFGFPPCRARSPMRLRWGRAYRRSLSLTWRRGGIRRRASASSMHRFIKPRLCAARWKRWSDFDYLNAKHMRLTVGAVNARSGAMRYFDTRSEPLCVEHVMASGALPPAFPAVRIDSEPYWDGGIYSNTPIEAVLDDEPRRSSVIFSVQVWNPDGSEPESVLDVLDKHKENQYASRASNIEQQRKLHRLRHVIRELTKHLPQEELAQADVRELASWGCGTDMHVVSLRAPRIGNEDHTKDIDFSASGIRARWQAGYDDTQRFITLRPWDQPIDPIEGIAIHELPEH